MDPYRNELRAAHERIAVLERELAANRSRATQSTPAPITEHLAADERLLWWAQPRSRHSASAFWIAIGTVLACCGAMFVLMVRGFPGRLLFLGGSVASVAVALWVAATVIRRRVDRRRYYALTDCRVLSIDQCSGASLTSVPLERCGLVRVQRRRGRRGDLLIDDVVCLRDLADVLAAERMLIAARKRCAADAPRP